MRMVVVMMAGMEKGESSKESCLQVEDLLLTSRETSQSYSSCLVR